MELQMYLNGKLVDSVTINAAHLRVLHAVQQKMEDKHSEILELANEEPQFYVEGIGSKMNDTTFDGSKRITWN
ncbi:MAG: hypothetical protein ACTHMD_04420 [Flavisolibacter sp.]